MKLFTSVAFSTIFLTRSFIIDSESFTRIYEEQKLLLN